LIWEAVYAYNVGVLDSSSFNQMALSTIPGVLALGTDQLEQVIALQAYTL